MASLSPYIVSSLTVVSLGLWHFCSSCLAFLRSPRDFSAKTWHPFPRRFRYLELYLELLAFLLALVYQAVAISGYEAVALSDPSQRTAASHRIVVGFVHLAMLVMFFVVLLITLVSETTGALPLPYEASFLLAGLAFSVEWMVLDRFADPQLVLERECFGLLARLAATCAVCCLFLAWRPKAFLVNLVLSASIALQGTWLMQTGLSLFSDRFIPEGCHRLKDLIIGSTQCDLEAPKFRAIALMDLAFICHVIAVIIVCAFLYGMIAKGVGYRRNGGYDPLETDGESDHLQMKPLSTKVVVD